MNVEDLGKLIVAKGFEKLPKVQKIAQSGHTDYHRKREEKEEQQRQRERTGEIISLFVRQNFFVKKNDSSYTTPPPFRTRALLAYG